MAMGSRFENKSKELLYDLAFILVAYGVLIAAATLKGGMPLSVLAPVDYVLQIRFAWPDWWTATVGLTAACLTIGLAVNPMRRIASYGDSRPATKAEAKKMGLLADKGIILGRAWGRYIRTDESLSIVVFAPPGTGKSAAIAIPTLLSAGHSFVVNDVKGELYDATAGVRRHYGRVVQFAPAEQNSAKWNPLGPTELPESWPAKITLVERIASRLYVIKDEGGDDYWPRQARALFAFYALYLLWKDGTASLPGIRSLALSTPDVQGWIADALDEAGDELPQRIREEGNGMLQKGDREFGSIFGTFKAGLDAFADPVVAENTQGECDFSAKMLRAESTTVYVKVSPEDIGRLAPLIRVLVEQMADQLLSTPWDKARERRITFLLDEMPRLGKLETILNMPALSRSYGVNALMIAQDYGQIEESYGKIGISKLDGTVEFHVIFQQSNAATAEAYSKKIGTTTRKKASTSKANGLRTKGGGSKSESDEGVPLFLPQEITDLDSLTAIILRKGHFTRPIVAKQARWYMDSALKARHAAGQKAI